MTSRILALLALATLAPQAAGAAPPRPAEIAAVCDGALRDADGGKLAPGRELVAGPGGLALVADAGARAWVRLPDGTSLFLHPGAAIRWAVPDLVVVRGAVTVAATTPLRAHAGEDGPAAAIGAGATATLTAPAPVDAAPPVADAAPPVTAALCLPRGPLVSIARLPVTLPDVAALRARAAGAGELAIGEGAGDVGDAVSSCGCVEGGGGGTHEWSGGGAQPEVEQK